MTRPLWQNYLDLINVDPSTSSPSGQDAPRVKQLLAELYRLGERPTPEEVAAYLKTHNHGKPLGLDQNKVLSLWTERLRHPHRRWRARPALRAGPPRRQPHPPPQCQRQSSHGRF